MKNQKEQQKRFPRINTKLSSSKKKGMFAHLPSLKHKGSGTDYGKVMLDALRRAKFD